MTLPPPVFAAASTVRNEVTKVPISGISHSRHKTMRTDLVSHGPGRLTSKWVAALRVFGVGVAAA